MNTDDNSVNIDGKVNWIVLPHFFQNMKKTVNNGSFFKKYIRLIVTYQFSVT